MPVLPSTTQPACTASITSLRLLTIRGSWKRCAKLFRGTASRRVAVSVSHWMRSLPCGGRTGSEVLLLVLLRGSAVGALGRSLETPGGTPGWTGGPEEGPPPPPREDTARGPRTVVGSSPERSRISARMLTSGPPPPWWQSKGAKRCSG